MLCRPGGFRTDKLWVERYCYPARNLVLQREQIASVAVKPLRPEMRIGLGIDQLGVDADLFPRPTDASFEYVAHAQFAADLLCVHLLVPVRERGISRDHKHI